MNYHTEKLNSNVKGRIGYAVVPGQVAHGPHFGTWMLSLNKFGKNKEWAYRALVWLTAADQQKRMLKTQLHPTRKSVYRAAGNDEFYKVLGQSLALGVGRPRLTNYGDVDHAIFVAVNRAASGSDPAKELKNAAGQLLGAAQKRDDAPRAPVDVDDEIVTLLRFASGAIGSVEATRNGRNNFLTFEVHGEAGSIAFNYERRDELQLCLADDPERRGFRTIYTGPAHPYGGALWPIPALGIGYGDTKIIECHDLMKAIVEGTPASPSFADGYQIARIADAITESAETEAWVDVPALEAAAV